MLLRLGHNNTVPGLERRWIQSGRSILALSDLNHRLYGGNFVALMHVFAIFFSFFTSFGQKMSVRTIFPPSHSHVNGLIAFLYPPG